MNYFRSSSAGSKESAGHLRSNLKQSPGSFEAGTCLTTTADLIPKQTKSIPTGFKQTATDDSEARQEWCAHQGRKMARKLLLLIVFVATLCDATLANKKVKKILL